MFKHLKEDLPASLVVYLVALPLCLGIAIASDAPLFSGMIAGIVGGIVVGSLSGSHVSVSGPAAGLAVIVATNLGELKEIVLNDQTAAAAGEAHVGYHDAFALFTMAVVLAGVMQVILGYLKAGAISNFIPSSVIKGMLAAIGLLLIMKQLPHALGIDSDFEGNMDFENKDGHNTFTELWYSLQAFQPGALIISSIAGLIISLWNLKFFKRFAFFKLIPGALIAVIIGTLVNGILTVAYPEWALSGDHLVNLPLDAKEGNPQNLVSFPDWRGLQLGLVYQIALVLAIIASLESLLSLEAADKIDPYRRITPTNQELKAQGAGNIVSGLIGGLPITAVIVRSSANVVAGSRTKLSAIAHGILLLLSVLLFPELLNLIPKAALAAVLILVGYKLISYEVLRQNYLKGLNQFVPFVVTIIAIVLTDLLKGIGIGLIVGIIYVIKNNYTKGITFIKNGNQFMLKLRQNVSYLNKSIIQDYFEQIPEDSTVLIDGGSVRFIDPDIHELINDFIKTASKRNIKIEIKRTYLSENPYFKTDGLKFDNE